MSNSKTTFDTDSLEKKRKMKLFDVYPRFDITLRKAKGVYLWDNKDQKYLDLYGGHGVISIGHNRSYYNSQIKSQLQKIAFYSNSVNMP